MISFFAPFEDAGQVEFVRAGFGPPDLAKSSCSEWRSISCLYHERLHLQPGIKVELVLVAVDQRRSVRHGFYVFQSAGRATKKTRAGFEPK